MKKYIIFIEDMEGQGSDLLNSIIKIDGTEPSKEEYLEIDNLLGDLGVYLNHLNQAIFEIADLYYINNWEDNSVKSSSKTPTPGWCLCVDGNLHCHWHRDLRDLEKIE